MFFILAAFVLGSLLIKLTYKLLRISLFLKIPSLIDYPVLDFFYSNYKFLVGTMESRQKYFNSLVLSYDKYFKLWFGPIPAVVVTGPDQIKKVLSSPKCSEKFNFFYEFIDTKNSLVSGSMLHRWPVARKFCNTSFSPNSLQSMRVNFEKSAKDLQKMLDIKIIDGKEFDFHVLMIPISFEIFSEVFLGLSGYEENEKFMKTLELNVRKFKAKVALPFIYPKTFYKLTTLYKEEIEGNKTQKKLINYAIEMRKKKKLANENSGNVENLMIDRFLENSDKFDNVEIVDLLNNIMQSVDSFGSFISNTILLLAMHPEVQEKLHEELQTVLGDEDYDVLPAENANKLKYMEMVMKESMRLIPQIPIMIREVLDDFEIEPGIVIPKSTTLVISLLMLHRDKKYWGDDAEKFKPERFSEESFVPGSNFFFPFSAGQRICIGMKFSYVAGKIILARLLKEYRYTTSYSIKDLNLDNFESMIVYKFKLPHLVTAQRRNKY